MKNSILNLIKKSSQNPEAIKSLDNIFKLYEQLQYAVDLNQVADDIFSWLKNEFKIENMVFSLFDIHNNTKINIKKIGNEFFLDDDLSHFFIINTHTSLNATISFCATSKEHSESLESKYDIIESSFFLISPIVQSAILRKNFIESSSLDSVTNVFTRQYIIDSLHSYLKISNNNQNEFYLLMIGIDRFKAVIEEFNYEIADKVLIELAKIIHTNIDEFDMVGRVESDIFLVSILSNIDEYQVSKIAKKIISDFSEVEVIVDEYTGQTLKKTVSIGFEKFEKGTDKTLDDAIKNADIALAEAKNKGRGEFFKFAKLSTSENYSLF